MAVSKQWKLLALAATLGGLVLGAACGGDDGGDDKNDNTQNTNKADAATANGMAAQLEANVAGKACKADSECAGTNALCLKDPQDADAVGTCTGGCEEDKQCGAGGTCVKASSALPGACAKVCTAPSDCGSDQLDCMKGIDFSNLLTQFQGAIGDAGIDLGDAGVSGNATPKTCQPKGEPLVTLGAGIVGKACEDDTACGGGTCNKTIPLVGTFPGGYCSASCMDDSTCGSTGGCGRGNLAVSFNAPGQCFLKCTSNSDCRTGYECGTSTQLLGAGKYCILPPRTRGDAGVADASVADASTDAGGDAGTLP